MKKIRNIREIHARDSFLLFHAKTRDRSLKILFIPLASVVRKRGEERTECLLQMSPRGLAEDRSYNTVPNRRHFARDFSSNRHYFAGASFPKLSFQPLAFPRANIPPATHPLRPSFIPLPRASTLYELTIADDLAVADSSGKHFLFPCLDPPFDLSLAPFANRLLSE